MKSHKPTISRVRIVTAGTLFILAAAMAVVGAGGGSATTGPNANTDSFIKGPTVDTSSVIVQLKGDPLSTSVQTKPAPGKKINFNSNTVKSYRAQLAKFRNDFKNWLQANAPNAKITSQYDVSLNAVAVKLNGTSLQTIAGAPMVQQIQYNALYHHDLSQSYKIIHASGAWTAAGGRAHAGAGIMIGDIDTGIDQNHPFFDPTGFTYPSADGPWPKCDAADSTTHTPNKDCKYVTPKVIVAKVFNNKLNQNGFDAEAVQDHGTHTAGIAAGVTGKTAVVQGVSIDDMSGIAPGAWLGNYNVFPGNVLNARSEDILNAVDAAVQDGMDVLNLSLGGGFHGNNDLLAIGLDNAVDAGVVVAVAAGNSGPGAGTVESPGRARKVVTVGASTNQHFVGEPFTYPAGGGTTIGAAVGDFAPLPTRNYDLSDTNSLACNAGTLGTNSTNNPPLGNLTGKLAIVNRGACTFSEKVANANAAGAVGVVVVNNVAGDPTAMARTAGFDDNIPAVMIGLKEGAALRTSAPTTASAIVTLREFITKNADILAGFSSQGPTTVDLAVKPDLTSVGVNVLSSITTVGKSGADDIWAFFSGTSMSTPHIAGSAAVLLDVHPDWSPEQVKSALTNTADRVIKDAKTGASAVGPTAQGAGRENLTKAKNATVWFEPVSASFGKVSGSNNNATPFAITLSNVSGAPQTFSLTASTFTPSSNPSLIPYDAGTISAGDGRISFPSSVTVPADGTSNLTVSVKPGLAKGTVVQGWITLTGPSGPYHFAYYAVVGP